MQVWNYGYDLLGNTTAVKTPTTSVAYQVDGLGRRVQKKNGAYTQHFLYDGPRLVAELDGSDNVISVFVYGTRVNVPDYMMRGGATYRFILDQLGSVRLVVDSLGNVKQRIDYDEFGVATVVTDPCAPFTACAPWQPFGFAGGLFDVDTGLVRFGERDYDASVGRWTTKDPIRFGGGMDLYAYSGSDPINRVDSSGDCPWCVSVIVGAGIGAGFGALGAYLSGGDIWAGVAAGALSGGVAGLTFGASLGADAVGVAAGLVIGVDSSLWGFVAKAVVTNLDSGSQPTPSSLATDVGANLVASLVVGQVGLAGLGSDWENFVDKRLFTNAYSTGLKVGISGGCKLSADHEAH